MQHQPTSSSNPIRRRRKTLTSIESNNGGGSSREASAESNDETETDTSLSHSITNNPNSSSSSSSNSSNSPTSLIFNGINKPNHSKRHQPTTTATNLLSKLDLKNVEDEISEGHDGDISSATTAPTPSHSFSSKPTTSTTLATATTSTTPSNLYQNSTNSSSSSSLVQSTSNSTTTSPIMNKNSLKLPSISIPSTSGGVSQSRNDSLVSTVSTEGGDYYQSTPPSPHHSPKAVAASRYPGHSGEEAAPLAWQSAPTGFLSNLTAEEIQEHIRTAIEAKDSIPGRNYKINPPPVDRPVRIYADGVYDLLHYGHMLQLRQCKLAFPSVYLLVGVCSSSLVRQYKASPVLTSSERYESVRHCKWVDEVVENAPWTIDSDFLKKWEIDYVAHDEEPYVSAGSGDVYGFVKSEGRFLPTRRTGGVSTSEILQRIVEGYREGDYDNKFLKLSRPDLCSTRAPSETGTGGTSHSKQNALDLSSSTNLPLSLQNSTILESSNTVEEKVGGDEEEAESKEELIKKLEVNA